MVNVILGIFLLAGNLTAEKTLEQADAFRSPQGSFEARVEVVDRDGSSSKFKVYIEGNDRSMIVTEAPARDVGRNMLMVDRDMWMFMPSIKRAVRIALRQRLMGQVAQGDISRMKWKDDYHAKFIEGQSVLLLTAKKSDLTYDQIKLSVNPKDNRPLRAEFQTKLGKTLKVATFEDFGILAGRERVQKIRIQDALKDSETSEIRILEMKESKFPTGFFSQTNLSNPRK